MRRLLTLMAVASLALAAPAGAQSTNAPPGNAGVDEYLESIPEAGGSRPTNRANDDGAALPADVRKALEAQGADGAAAAALAERTGPGKGTVAEGGSGSATQPAGGELAVAGDEGGILAELSRAAQGSEDGMGILFPLLLALSALGALAIALARRRSSS